MKKKIIATIAAGTLLLSMLTACGQKATCDFCGEEKICATKSVFGEEIKICGDCQSELENIGW